MKEPTKIPKYEYICKADLKIQEKRLEVITVNRNRTPVPHKREPYFLVRVIDSQNNVISATKVSSIEKVLETVIIEIQRAYI